MYRFFSFSRLTPNGLSGLPNWSGPDRLEGALSNASMVLKGYYWSPLGGRFDLMVISESSSIEDMAEVKKAMIPFSAVNTDTYLVDVTFERNIDQTKPLYVSFGRWTDQGMQSVATSSIKHLESELQHGGITLCGVYWVMAGSGCDVITLTQADNVEAIGTSRLARALKGRLRTEVHVVNSQESFAQACAALDANLNWTPEMPIRR